MYMVDKFLSFNYLTVATISERILQLQDLQELWKTEFEKNGPAFCPHTRGTT